MSKLCARSGYKTIFDTQVAAWESMSHADPTREQGVPTRAYRCQHCHRWHLTSQALPRAGRRAPARGRLR